MVGIKKIKMYKHWYREMSRILRNQCFIIPALCIYIKLFFIQSYMVFHKIEILFILKSISYKSNKLKCLLQT